MKFLFLSPVTWNFYPLQNQNLALSLSRAKHEVVYAEPLKYKNHHTHNRFAELRHAEPPSNLIIEKRSTRIPRSLIVFFVENYLNVRLIRRHKPDVVVCYDHLSGLFSCLLCLFVRTKFVFNVSDDWDNMPQHWGGRLLWKILVKPVVTRLSAAVACISFKQLALMKKRHIKSFWLPNGLLPEYVQTVSETRRTEEQPTVNFIANLRNWYNFELLFSIFEALPEVQLNIYGSGPLYDELLQKAEKHHNISIKGNIPHEKTPELLKNASLGLLPLHQNTLNDSTSPIKLFDYWAAGLAVVATPTAELLSLGDDCILFAHSKEEWIKQIRFLLNNPYRRVLLGQTGLAKVTETHNYNAICDMFLNQIKRLNHD